MMTHFPSPELSDDLAAFSAACCCCLYAARRRSSSRASFCFLMSARNSICTTSRDYRWRTTYSHGLQNLIPIVSCIPYTHRKLLDICPCRTAIRNKRSLSQTMACCAGIVRLWVQREVKHDRENPRLPCVAPGICMIPSRPVRTGRSLA